MLSGAALLGEAEGQTDIAAPDPHRLLHHLRLLHLSVDTEAGAEEEVLQWSSVCSMRRINSADRDRCPAPWLIPMSACHTTSSSTTLIGQVSRCKDLNFPASLSSMFKRLHVLAGLEYSVVFCWSMTMGLIEACVHGIIPTQSISTHYLLTSQDLTVKDAPLPSRDNQMLFWAHAATVGGLHSILKFRNMAPMEAHNAPNNNTFYAIGHPMYGGPEDDWSIARVIHNAATSAKNVAQIIVCGTAWGSLAKISGGSWVTSVKATENDQVYRDKNGTAYVISRNGYNIAGVAYAATMNPPSTAATLLHEYARASGQDVARSSRAAAALLNR